MMTITNLIGRVMTLFGVNVVPVILGAIASMAAGTLWYTVLFTRPYLEELGKTSEELAKGPGMFVASSLQFVGCVAIAFTLGWLMEKTGTRTMSGGVGLSVVVWLGFVVAVVGPMYAYQAFSMKLFAIVAGNILMILAICGGMLGAWKT